MTLSQTRITLPCTFLLALCSVSSFAQSGSTSDLSTSGDAPTILAESLPDAPSFQQTVYTATQPVIPQVRTAPAPPDSSSGVVAPGQTPCDARTARRAAMTPEQLKAEESQYTAGILPNFNTVLNNGEACVPRLTAAQKWNLVYHSSTAPFTIGLDALLAGYDEIDGSHNGYGWGAQGYFKRFGAQYADTVSGAVIGNAILPIILHQDPRYFQIGPGHPVLKRAWHAALSTIICKGDNGKTEFSYSNVFGNLLSGALSNLYYPSDERGIGLTFSSALTVTAEGAFGAQLLEFSTEISKGTHHLFHGKDKEAPMSHVPPSNPVQPVEPAKP